VSSKLRPYLRSIYRTLVIWICKAFGLLLLIHFIPGLNVNSVYDPTNDEVAAFEELIGSHGGLGGTQCKPFVLYPAEWGLDQQEIAGAEKLRQLFKSKLHVVQARP
jgi:hypothetical protein